MSYKMLAPGPGQPFQAPSQNYISDANGIVQAVAIVDLAAMEAMGCRLYGVRDNLAGTAAPGVSNDSTQGYAVGSQWHNTVTGIRYFCTSVAAGAATWSAYVATVSAPSGNGLTPARLNLLGARNSDGSAIAGGAAAGKFGVALTAGTSQALVSEAANSNTKTDVAIFEHTLPGSYIAGQNVSLIVNCNYVLGSGTVGTHTLTPSVYRSADAGTQGINICSAVQTVPAAAADLTFTITGTTLNPGDRLMISLSLVIQDTGASNITAVINSVRLA